MACVILWSKRAEKGFNAIVEYLSAEWTEKEVRVFVKYHHTDQYQRCQTEATEVICPTLRYTKPGLSNHKCRPSQLIDFR